MRPLIKICGIKDSTIAYQTAKLGADFVGMNFHPSSIRSVTVNEAILLAEHIRKGGAQPVGVFVDHTADEIIDICQKTNIQIVQCHGDTARDQHHLLPKSFVRIFVLPLTSLGAIAYQNNEALAQLDSQRDYLVFEHLIAGIETPITPPKTQSNISQLRCFLAGGLTQQNVVALINQQQPFGVDVCGGIEKQKGIKDIHLIEHFIKTVQTMKVNQNVKSDC